MEHLKYNILDHLCGMEAVFADPVDIGYDSIKFQANKHLLFNYLFEHLLF